MKKMLIIMVIAIAASPIAFGQTKMSKDTGNSVETQIIALENKGGKRGKIKTVHGFKLILRRTLCLSIQMA